MYTESFSLLDSIARQDSMAEAAAKAELAAQSCSITGETNPGTQEQRLMILSLQSSRDGNDNGTPRNLLGCLLIPLSKEHLTELHS